MRPEEAGGRGEGRAFLALFLGFAFALCLFFLLGGDGLSLWPSGEGGEEEVPRKASLPPPPESGRRTLTAIEGMKGVESPILLLCVDAEDGGPLPGVRAYDLTAGKELGASDRRGGLRIPRLPPSTVLLHGEGFLSRLLGSVGEAFSRKGPVEVGIHRDRYSLALEVEPRWPRDAKPEGTGVFHFKLMRTDGIPEDGLSLPHARQGREWRVSPSLRSAWLRHHLLMTMEPDRILSREEPVAWHLGLSFQPKALPIEGGRIRFAQEGPFRLVARGPDHFVARAEFRIEARARNRLILEFRAGEELVLELQDILGEPVVGAVAYLSRPEEEGGGISEQWSDAGGRVVFDGLFPSTRYGIRIEASGYGRLEKELRATGKVSVLRLQAASRRGWEVRVQERRSGRFLAGAMLRLFPGAGAPLERITDKEGRATLPLVMGEEFRLEIEADGYLPYAELLGGSREGRPPDRFELLPSDAELQRGLGLLCIIEGRITTAPLEGQALILLMRDPGFQAPVPNPGRRRILRGEDPLSRLRARSDRKGAFRLFTARSGMAELLLSTGGRKRSRNLQLVPGTRLEVQF